MPRRPTTAALLLVQFEQVPLKASPSNSVPVHTPLEPTDAPVAVTGTALTVQFDTPNVAALNSGESAVRGVPGVTSASTTSMALGGISVMRVTFEGSQASLTAALRGRGWQVDEGPGVLRIRRGGGGPAAPATPAPAEAGNDSDG